MLTLFTYGLYFVVKENRVCGFAAISLIVALLITALLAFFAVLYFSGQHGLDSAGSKSPIQRAKNVQCLAQIKKLEMQVQLYSAQNGRYPENLEMLDGLNEIDLYCPVTQSRYGYDLRSGRISCPDHSQ
jgi:hypothetical protein